MNAPVHSAKHLQSEYKRYHMISVISAIVTIVTIILAALTGFQAANISKQQTQSMLAAQLNTEERMKHESDVLKERAVQLEQMLEMEKATVQELNVKIARLQKRISQIKTEKLPPAVVSQPPQDPAENPLPTIPVAPSVAEPTAVETTAPAPQPADTLNTAPLNETAPHAEAPVENSPED